MAEIVEFPQIKVLPDTRIVDITGNKYGRLTVLGYAGKDTRVKTGGAMWMCRCDCGTMRKARGGQLRAGKIKTCGKCRKRGGDIVEAIVQVEPPPCERHCPSWDACAATSMACEPFHYWYQKGGRITHDIENYPPSRAIYNQIFDDEQQKQGTSG